MPSNSEPLLADLEPTDHPSTTTGTGTGTVAGTGVCTYSYVRMYVGS